MKNEGLRASTWPLQPIGALCFFAGLVEVFLVYPVTKLSGLNQTLVTVFLIVYPFTIAIGFLYLLIKKPHHLYPPSEWSNQQEWLKTLPATPRNEHVTLTDFKGHEGEQFQIFGNNHSSQYFEESYLDESHIENTIEHFKGLATKEPWNSKHHLNLGNAFRRNTEYEKAIEAYSRCIEIDSKNVFALHYKALCLKRIGNADEAVKLYYEVMNIDPSFAKPKNNLAFYYAETGKNLDIATSLIESALEQQSLNPNYIDTKGLIEYALGNFVVAEKLFIKASNLRKESGKPESATISGHLLMIQNKLQKK